MSSLFADIDEQQLDTLLTCLKTVTRTYRKEEFIFIRGDRPSYVGIMLSGGANVLMEEPGGQRVILSHVSAGQLFGEAFSCANLETLPVSIVASEPSEIMLIDYCKLVTTCSRSCPFHHQLIMNMMRILATNNIQLTEQIGHLSKRTIREKLLSLLSMQARQADGRTVEIPFNRQELADYLCVDRSALSRELSAMQAEGILRCGGKRCFELNATAFDKH